MSYISKPEVRHPALEKNAGARCEPHGIRRQKLHLDLERGGVADLDERLGGGDDALALSEALQDAAIHR